MTIAVTVLEGHPADPLVWSGTPSQLLLAGQQVGADFTPMPFLRPCLQKLVLRGADLTRKLGPKVNWEVEPAVLRRFSSALADHVRDGDVVLALGWYPDRRVLGSVPVVLWRDATFGQRVDTAPHWSRLSSRTRRQLAQVEREGLLSASHVVFSTRWAADAAKAEYGLPEDRISLVPMGATLPVDPGPLERELPEEVRLLLVGVDWQRKGIDRAVLAVDELTGRGRSARLDVVGVDAPSSEWLRPNVTFHGRIPRDSPQLDSLYRDATVFLLPGRSEPFGIVLAEAAAYSLPVVASAVDGITERLADGQLGRLVMPTDDPDPWADAIEAIVADDAAYKAMASSGRVRYETDFTWTSSARRLERICLGVRSS